MKLAGADVRYSPDGGPNREMPDRPGFDRDANNGYSRTAPDLPVGMDPGSDVAPPTNGVSGTGRPDGGQDGELGTTTSVAAAGTHPADSWCLEKARAIYRNSKDYLEANITTTWERNLYHFRGEHGPGTPYARRDWKRARTFRPKTRANVKAQEASHASAAFSTSDYLQLSAFDQSDLRQTISAEITKNLAQHRLTTVPWNWFVTAQGAYQDTKNYGVCISHQYWQYMQIEAVVPAMDDQGQPITGAHPDTGELVPMGTKGLKTVMDMPMVDLVPPECFLFDPMCDWRNPAQTSPYLCLMVGMYASDVLDRMEYPDSKTGMPLWRPQPLAKILSARREATDNRTRRAREGRRRMDPTLDSASPEYSMVWAHLNILREKGEDIAWWTLGTDLMLTDPVPLAEMYPHLRPGERPFVVGFSSLEAHRNYPAGDVEQIAPLQEEINAIANQRIDNVRLVLNKRYFIRRGSQMDLEALMRNVPGGGVMTNDPVKDVQVVSTPDVTSSAYKEQELLSSDLDELVGGFGQQAAAGAGKMVDRAGSLDAIQGAAGAVQDYSIKLFFSTWMEPTLSQFVKMLQKYETDENLLAVASQQSDLFIRYGQSDQMDVYLQQELITIVDVGIGNTDPMKRVQKLVFGVGQVNQLPDMPRRMKSMKIADEIMGALGYKNSARFYMNDAELQEHVKTTPPPPPPPEIALKQQELQIRQADNQARDKRETLASQQTHDWRMQALSMGYMTDDEKLQHQLGIAAAKNQTARDIAATKENNRLAEINMKRADGARPKPAPAPISKGPPGKK